MSLDACISRCPVTTRSPFLELPLLGYVFAPGSTEDRVTRFKAWMGRSGRSAAVIGAVVIGVLLIARRLITLL
jgi:hypothetical protein